VMRPCGRDGEKQTRNRHHRNECRSHGFAPGSRW
jgi:hypothetical protein